MSWIAVAATTVNVGMAAYSATRKKPNSALENFQLPEYYEDKDYRKMQDYMTKLGPGMLEGDIPEYYQGIGETGGAEFENYLNLIKGDIEKSGLDAAAATGRGGGGVQDMITEATGKATTNERWKDYNRALEGKGFLFKEGRGITESARLAGQNEGINRNKFNLNIAGKEIDLGKYWDDYDAMGREWEEKKNETTAGYASSALGSAAGIFSDGGGGGTDWGGILKGLSGALKVDDPKKKRGSL